MSEVEFVDCKGKYRTEYFEAETSLEYYFKNYVDIPHFDKYCRECKNYNKSWECPPHTENIPKYWKSFSNIKLFAIKVIYDEDFIKKPYSSPQLNYIIKNTLYRERRKFRNRLSDLEKEYNGQYLYGGRCDICKRCAKRDNEPCRNPKLMRFSVESIGANTVKTTCDFFNFKLKWINKDHFLPEYLTLVCALLY